MDRSDDLLTTTQVCEQYPALNPGTMRYWRHNNEGPASFTLGPQGRRGRVVYRRSEVERWIADQEQATRRGGAA
ncbi:helix-turn-helix domain-containing protein [Mycolicibacterium komossense]|nr:helix-turn-helix domain-containing protein [Mycolicibacterium komossense]